MASAARYLVGWPLRETRDNYKVAYVLLDLATGVVTCKVDHQLKFLDCILHELSFKHPLAGAGRPAEAFNNVNSSI